MPPTATLPDSDPMWSHKRRTERSVPVTVLSWKMSPPSRVPGGAWMYSMFGYPSPSSRALGQAAGPWALTTCQMSSLKDWVD